jgi:hypothetical protein
MRKLARTLLLIFRIAPLQGAWNKRLSVYQFDSLGAAAASKTVYPQNQRPGVAAAAGGIICHNCFKCKFFGDVSRTFLSSTLQRPPLP